jgi:prepilin-type N-terminal cleavage/methylation domain-containing protein
MISPRSSVRHGFTLTELLVVIVVIVVLVGLLFPSTSGNRPKASRIQCVNNLKNVGLALRIFAADHARTFPGSLPVASGGFQEPLADASQLWRHWLVVTSQLATPKLLLCPADKRRVAAAAFAPATNLPSQFVFSGNHQLSYFLGLNATEMKPASILAGDRNLTTNGTPVAPGRHVFPAGTRFGFTAELHDQSGNGLLGDGSVQQVTGGRLNEQFRDALTATGHTNDVWVVP